MIQRQQNNLTFFQFSLLTNYPELRHGVFSREGGFSRGPFKSLNVGLNVGDGEDVVARNRDLISDCMGFTKTVFIQQVHGDRVLTLKKGDGAIDADAAAIKADALISDAAGLLLAIQVADCQAVLLYDPIRRVVANVHAGWRGSVANIIAKTIKVMQTDFGCRPAHLLAAVGPSLGPCCAEFVNHRRELPPTMWAYGTTQNHFDFWAISRDQLISAGVVQDNIETGGLCTKCRQDLFYSFRGAKTTGRFAAVIGLAET